MADLIDSELTPGQRIDTLYCWVATYPDGTEGIVAVGVEGLGVTPLVSAHRRTAVAMEGYARRAADAAAQGGRRVATRLMTFANTDTERG